MAGGSLDIELGSGSEYVTWVEGLGNPWVPIVAWLEHRDPLIKPQNLKKRITVMVALQFRDSPDPGQNNWRQAIVVKNETSSAQKLRVHFLAADSFSGEFTVSGGKATALDHA